MARSMFLGLVSALETAFPSARFGGIEKAKTFPVAYRMPTCQAINPEAIFSLHAKDIYFWNTENVPRGRGSAILSTLEQEVPFPV